MRTPIDLLGDHAMNATAISFTLAPALAVVSPAMAQATQPHAPHPAAAASADAAAPINAGAAVAEAERFNSAPSRGDLAPVEATLAPAVPTPDSGGAAHTHNEARGKP